MFSKNIKNIVLSLVVVIFCIDTAFAEIARLRCMWREDPTTSMVVAWDQIVGTNPVLYYAPHQLQGQRFEGYAKARIPDKVLKIKGMNNHFVRLTGLTPNTRYFFKVNDNRGSSKTYSFQTAPSSPYTRLSIIAGGDSRNHRKGRINANKLVGKLQPHFVLFGGDMTGADNEKQWPLWFDDWQHTISKDGKLTPIVVTRGNHEYANKTLMDLFDVHTKDVFYAFTFGTDLLRVYTLNSLIPAGGKQQRWLANDLQQNTSVQWRMAQYHHTIRPHTKGKPEKNEQLLNWATLFHKFKVQVVVESDAHVVKTTYPIKPSKGPNSYEGFARDDENGTIYLGEGCWGAPLRAANDSKPWTRASGSFNQFKWLFIDRDGIEIRTVKTDEADLVPHSDPFNVFTIPSQLNIWSPNGESTIYVKNKGAASPVNYGAQNFTSNNFVARTTTTPPIEVKQFNASLVGKDIEVKWMAKQEPLQLQYEIQRSIGGSTYVTIAKMQGKSNNSNQNPTYQFRDAGLGITAQGKYIKYRLKYKSINGQISYYHPPVPKLDGDSKNSQKVTVDNNGRVQIKYQILEDCAVSFQLFNAFRKEVFRNQLINQEPKNYLKSLDISQLPKGEYVLVVKAGEEEIERLQVLKE